MPMFGIYLAAGTATIVLGWMPSKHIAKESPLRVSGTDHRQRWERTLVWAEPHSCRGIISFFLQPWVVVGPPQPPHPHTPRPLALHWLVTSFCVLRMRPATSQCWALLYSVVLTGDPSLPSQDKACHQPMPSSAQQCSALTQAGSYFISWWWQTTGLQCVSQPVPKPRRGMVRCINSEMVRGLPTARIQTQGYTDREVTQNHRIV